MVPGNSGQAQVKTPGLIQRWELGGDAPGSELFCVSRYVGGARRLALPTLSLPPPLIPPKSPCSTTPSSPGQDLEKVPSEEETETGGRVTST